MSTQELVIFIRKFEVKNYDEAKEALSIISKQLKKVSNKNRTQFIKELINESEELRFILKIIIDKLLPLLKHSLLDDFFDSTSEIMIVDLYIILNDINIGFDNDEIDEFIDSFENIDIVRAYFSHIKNHKILTKDEERRLCMKIALGDLEARDTLVLHNLKLVVYLARQFYYSKIDIIDLIQEGNIGLIKAAEKYDVTKNHRFISYARVAITSYMRRYILCNSSIITHSEEIQRLKNKYYKLRYVEKLSDDEVFKLLNISKERFNEVKRYFGMYTSSIDVNIALEGEKPLAVSLVDNDDYFSKGEDEKLLLKESLMKLFKSANLNDDEIEIVLLYHGFYRKEYTFQEIADNYNFGAKTKFGISLKYNAAINKIRMCPLLEDFAVYMDRPNDAMDRVLKYADDIRSKKYPITQNFNSRKIQNESEKQIDTSLDIKGNLLLLSEELGEDISLIELALKFLFGRREIERLKQLGYNNINESGLNRKLENITEVEKAELKNIINMLKEKRELILYLENTNPIDRNVLERLLKMLKDERFNEVKKRLNKTELIILLLKLGFIDDAVFSDDFVASFLNMSLEEVKNIINSLMLNYYDEVKIMIDQRIEQMAKIHFVMSKKAYI